MDETFETEVVAGDGVWSVTFERQPGLASWGDVSFWWRVRATHPDGRKHISHWAISGVLGIVLKNTGFDPEAVLELFVSQYRRRIDRILPDPGSKNVIEQRDYTQLTQDAPNAIDRIGRELDRLTFHLSNSLVELRRFQQEGGTHLDLGLPTAEVFVLERVVMDSIDPTIDGFHDAYAKLIETTVNPQNTQKMLLEVRRLIRVGGVAARKTWEQPAPPAPPAPPTEAVATTPAQFVVPGYELLEQLGEGGFGIVHRARDGAGVERAIKVLAPIVVLPQANTRERFKREAIALSRLDHRNIAKYLQLSEGPSGWYLVMELVRGSNLHRWSRDKSFKERVGVVAASLDGLAHMHEQDVIHRDLKPSNIVVEDATGRAAIVDFGLAWLATDDGADGLNTRGSTWSAAYAPPESIMSPEQSRSPLHDIYSMGIVLYEILAGNRRGFVDGVPLASTAAELGAVDPVVQQATARAASRFQTATDFAVALRQAGDGIP